MPFSIYNSQVEEKATSDKSEKALMSPTVRRLRVFAPSKVTLFTNLRSNSITFYHPAHKE